jgi:hypothetical protein
MENLAKDLSILDGVCMSYWTLGAFTALEK